MNSQAGVFAEHPSVDCRMGRAEAFRTPQLNQAA